MSTIATTDLTVHDEVLGIDRKVFAGQPIPPDLIDAYRDAGGDVDEVDVQAEQRIRGLGGEVVIATEDKVVHDEVIGIDRHVFAGQPVPPDLVEAYGGGETADSAPEADATPAASYDAQSVDELEAEAAGRGLEVEGTGKDGNVLKADLVAALKADDGKGA